MSQEDAASTAPAHSAVLSVRGVTKTYPGTTALDDVSLDILPGEIHSIVGGNGSGKSTLVKILGGVLAADRGTVVIGGQEHDLTDVSPTRARRAGLHVVHQHRTVFDSLTVAENLAIGRGFDTVAAIGRAHV